MIITVTPNPSIDRTLTLSTPMVRGEVHRLSSVSDQPAGKGVNVSRAAVAAGVPTLAVLPAGDGDGYVRDLRAAGIPVAPVAPAGSVRVNLAVIEPGGATTKLNSPGDQVSAEDLHRLSTAVLDAARRADGGDWVVLAGSVPPGTPPEWYAGLVDDLRTTPVRIAVDTSDAPLAALVAAFPGAAPDLIKPNGAELASLTGADADLLEADPSAAARAAAQLVERGAGAVLATLGKGGAVLVDTEGAWHAMAPPVTVLSTVGAGDSSLFGYLLGHSRGLGAADRLALAVAYGSAAASLPGTTVPEPHQTHADRTRVRQLGALV